jgi:outer membrane receptor protein involved in Fe transport
VFYTPRSVDLNWPFETPITKRSIYYRGGNDIVNPKWAAKYYSNTSEVSRFFNSTSLNYDISPNLVATYRFGLDTYREVQETKLNRGGPSTSPIVLNGSYQTVNITNTIFNQDFILTYSKELSSKVKMDVLAGFNTRNDFYRQDGIASQTQLAFDLFRHTNFVESASRNLFTGGSLNLTEEQQRMGAYLQATLDYSGFFFVNLSGRHDWTSTVEKENRTILYPGASVSFIPTDAFDIKSNTLSYLKFRLGFGSSAGFPSPYNTRTVLGQNARGFVNSTGSSFTTHTLSNTLGNPNLKPELHQELEAGTEMKLFNNRLSVDFSVYNKNTRNLITFASLDPATGYTGTNINIGRVQNKGIEAVINGDVLKTASGLVWSATLNYNLYRSITRELADGFDQIPVAGFTDVGNFAIPGQPFNIIQGTPILRDSLGNRVVSGTGQYLAAGNIGILGDPNPRYTASLINSVSYKGFTLSFMFEYRHKGAIVSYTTAALLARGVSEDVGFVRELPMILPGVKQDGTPNDIMVTASGYTFDNYFFTEEAAVWDGTTIRLREASISYDLPKNIMSKTPFKAASIALSGTNLWFNAVNFPKYTNFDTDMLSLGVGNGLGFDYLTGPSARRFGGTLKLSF